MDQHDKHTPGPYDIRPTPGTHDAEIYSQETGESVARVLSGKSHGDGPTDETALRNAALLRAAPELHASLERMLQPEPAQVRSQTEQSARELLAGIATGPGKRFREERDEELRDFQEMMAEQAREMSRDYLMEIDQEQEEEFGHSF